MLTCLADDAEPLEADTEDEGIEVLTKPYQPSDVVHLIGALLKSDTFSIETEEILAEVREHSSARTNAGCTLNLSADRRSGAYRARRTAIRLGVMPFRTAETAEDNSFSLGLAEEITGAFARFRWLTCVSSASIPTVWSELPSPTSAWQELDLDFLVAGMLRMEANRISVQVRLLNIRGSGELIWSRGFDSSLLDLLNLQQRYLTSETAAQIAPEVLVWGGQRWLSCVLR